MCTYDISLASRAGPISERVVNPVALNRRAKNSIHVRGELYLEQLTLFPDLERILQELVDQGRPSSAY